MIPTSGFVFQAWSIITFFEWGWFSNKYNLLNSSIWSFVKTEKVALWIETFGNLLTRPLIECKRNIILICCLLHRKTNPNKQPNTFFVFLILLATLLTVLYYYDIVIGYSKVTGITKYISPFYFLFIIFVCVFFNNLNELTFNSKTSFIHSFLSKLIIQLLFNYYYLLFYFHSYIINKRKKEIEHK